MPKPTKSSASSATRKKHARKATGVVTVDPPVSQTKKEKGKGKKEPRQKSYIPPKRPTPINPDPIEVLGIAYQLPPELLVILRKLAKRDSTTKTRALEELHRYWFQSPDSSIQNTYEIALPVWLHHFPVLVLHSSRRIRALASSLQVALLQELDIKSQVLEYIHAGIENDLSEALLGSTCMTAFDLDRHVASQARPHFQSLFSTADTGIISTTLSFLSTVLFHPAVIYAKFYPVHRSVDDAGSSLSKHASYAEATLKSPAEQDEDMEGDDDRYARWRCSALGGLRWILEQPLHSSVVDEIGTLIKESTFWCMLYPIEDLEKGEQSFGVGFPPVRRNAWSVLPLLVDHYQGLVSESIDVIAKGVLQSAWIENDELVRAAMWGPLLKFLTNFPHAWTCPSMEQEAQADDFSQTAAEAEEHSERVVISETTGRRVFPQFLQFLELGCGGSPIQGYPTVVVILSTLPSSLLPLSDDSLNNLFLSFWAAVDGRALNSLDRIPASAAFLSSLLECLVFLAGSFKKAGFGDDISRLRFIEVQMTRLWMELLSQKLRVGVQHASTQIAKTLLVLSSLDEAMLDSAWSPIKPIVLSRPSNSISNPSYLITILSAIASQLSSSVVPSAKARLLVEECFCTRISELEQELSTGDMIPTESSSGFLELLLDNFTPYLLDNQGLTQQLSAFFVEKLKPLLKYRPTLVISYMKHQQDDSHCLSLWRSTLKQIADIYMDDSTLGLDRLAILLEIQESGTLRRWLRPTGVELDTLMLELSRRVLTGKCDSDLAALNIFTRILRSHEYYLTSAVAYTVISDAASLISKQSPQIFRGDELSTGTITQTLEIFSQLFETNCDLVYSSSLVPTLLPDIYLLAFIYPQSRDAGAGQGMTNAARRIWHLWRRNCQSGSLSNVKESVIMAIRDLFLNPHVLPDSLELVRAISDSPDGYQLDLLNILPQEAELDSLLALTPADPIPPSTSVLDTFFVGEATFSAVISAPAVYDHAGLSSYGRCILAMVQWFASHRPYIKKHPWALRHIMILANSAETRLCNPSGLNSFLGPNASETILRKIKLECDSLVTYLLTTNVPDEWHQRTIDILQSNPSKAIAHDAATAHLQKTFSASSSSLNARDAFIFYQSLKHLMPEASETAANMWISFARNLNGKDLLLYLAILYAVSRFGPNAPSLDRLRSEIVSSLTAVDGTKVNTEGLRLLRQLVAVAPNPNGEDAFMSTQRATFLSRSLQRWVTVDDDLEEDVQTLLTILFFYLAPILQAVPGAHWDFIFDILENNLENCSILDDATLSSMMWSLKLLYTIEDLASTNKSLNQSWLDRRSPILRQVHQLLLTATDPSQCSEPRTKCQELLLQVARLVPTVAMDSNTLAQMCHWLRHPSGVVQKLAYPILQQAADVYTEHIVIETATEIEAPMTIEIPHALVKFLSSTLLVAQGTHPQELVKKPMIMQTGSDPAAQNALGFMLAWVLVLDLFRNASLRVKTGYLEQLKSNGTISNNIVSFVMEQLDVLPSGKCATKLDIWDLDQFFVDLMPLDDSSSYTLLAAHLFYRLLSSAPSIVRTWWLECKDRQKSSTVAAFITRYYSTSIIQQELAQVRMPEVLGEISDDQLSIRVASSMNEITAIYVVDEQKMEIILKLPNDYPLHGIDVRDVRRIGVPENRWRAWLLAVQQVVNSQSGHIADGLFLFKKNISLHFEGQVECAICYSIISVTDRSLPNKPCKTCKNRFHASCLYKWFNTSHTSACPLCRSEIL